MTAQTVFAMHDAKSSLWSDARFSCAMMERTPGFAPSKSPKSRTWRTGIAATLAPIHELCSPSPRG